MPRLAGESRRLLSGASAGEELRRQRVARCHPAHRLGDAWLRLAAHHCRAAAAWLDDQSQARRAPHTGRQSAVPAAGPTRAHHRFAARADGLSEPGSRAPADGAEPAVGGRYHLYSAAARVRLPGGVVGRPLAALHRLATGPHAGDGADARSFADGLGEARRGACTGASFRSRLAIRGRRTIRRCWPSTASPSA